MRMSLEDHQNVMMGFHYMRRLAGENDHFADELRRRTGLYISDGGIYGDAGRGFVRINPACPKAMLYQGIERLRKARIYWLEAAQN